MLTYSYVLQYIETQYPLSPDISKNLPHTATDHNSKIPFDSQDPIEERLTIFPKYPIFLMIFKMPLKIENTMSHSLFKIIVRDEKSTISVVKAYINQEYYTSTSKGIICGALLLDSTCLVDNGNSFQKETVSSTYLFSPYTDLHQDFG